MPSGACVGAPTFPRAHECPGPSRASEHRHPPRYGRRGRGLCGRRALANPPAVIRPGARPARQVGPSLRDQSDEKTIKFLNE